MAKFSWPAELEGLRFPDGWLLHFASDHAVLGRFVTYDTPKEVDGELHAGHIERYLLGRRQRWPSPVSRN